MAEISGEKGFSAAFWKARKEENVDPDTFFGKYEHFMHFLDEYGIKEHPQGCSEVEADLERIRAYSSPLEGMYGVGNKERVVIEHDAKMRMLIEDLRGGNNWGSFSNVGHWMLTESTKLPTYARMSIGTGRRPRHPFCILSSSWAQIVRVMVPRTDDLDDMIVGLLASPYVGYKSAAGGVHLKAVERTVARIDGLRDVPPAVAVALIQDDAMASRIADETDPNEISRLVEEGLSQKADELQARLGRSAEEKVKADRERLEADERAREASDREAASVAEQRAAERKAREAEAAAKTARREAREARETETDLQREIRESQKKGDATAAEKLGAERRERLYRNALAFILALLVVGGGCALLLTGTVSGGPGSATVILATAALVYIAIRVTSLELAKEVVAIAAVTAAVAAVLAFAFAPSNSDHPNSPDAANGGKTP